MLRAAVSVALMSLALAGCSDSDVPSTDTDVRYAGAPSPMAPPREGFGLTDAPAGGDQKLQSGESFTYDHTLALTMASAFIKARFERARDRCQNDAALKCKVMSASFSLQGNPSAPLPVAYLSVALPHDGIAPYEASLLVPLEGEDAADVLVRSRAMNAQNVTQQVADIDRRLAQLVDYRERLGVLAKRRNASTDDLIKIESELSKTQTELEQIQSQKQQLAERIAKENMNISFEAQSTVGDAFQPVRSVWQSALRILGESTGAAIGFIIRLIPWLPLIALALYLIPLAWRRFRRKPS